MAAGQERQTGDAPEPQSAHFALIEPASGTGEDLASETPLAIEGENAPVHHNIPMGILLMLLAGVASFTMIAISFLPSERQASLAAMKPAE